MDRRERFLDAIGEVGSDLIFDAETKRFAPGPLRRWGGLAAALVLVAGLTVLALPWLQTDSTPQEAASSDTATEAPPPSGQDIVLETETEDTVEPEAELSDTQPDFAADTAQDEDELVSTGPEQYTSWTLNLPSYDDAKELWESGRAQQLLTNFVTTLESGCGNPWDPMLNFTDGSELEDLDLIRFFRLMLNQQKGNGWYSGPSYEDRWFEAQTGLEPASPYAGLGGWYDVPVSEIQSILSYWLTSYDLDPAELEDVMAEENTVRFDTLAPPEQEVPLLLEDATFFDDMQMMILRVARCTDDSLTVTAAVRYYCLIFDGGLVRYESIWTE